jgi:hypothetical protein
MLGRKGGWMTSTLQVTERQLEAFKRFLELLPHGKDRDLVILKAHLLVEEQLRQIISERLKNPAAVEDARLSFAQCAALARSSFPEGHDPDLWKATTLLNKIRNALAHQLEPRSIDKAISQFVTTIQPQGDYTPDPAVNFEFALWGLFASVSTLVERPSATVLRLVGRPLDEYTPVRE